jgi:hypothetical protein
MAEIIENGTGNVVSGQSIPGTGKVNAGLTLGIIGTALGALAGGGGLMNFFAGNARNGSSTSSTASGTTDSDLYVERQHANTLLNITENYYKNRISDILDTNAAFAALKQSDTDNSFQLYKYTRDTYDVLNAKEQQDTFNLYKNQRDADDILAAKIAEVDKKVDVMAAIRPYQDALIDSKINTNAILADYALNKRTCRMIEGQLVLPSTPTITGYGSYSRYDASIS